MVNWSETPDIDSLEARLFIDPTPGLVLPIPSIDTLREFSPAFVEIYRQSAEAERLGLDELVGMGYRKALEFLVKEFAISQHPGEEAKIRRAWLSTCIEKYITDDEIQACAAETAVLGNDAAHYEKRTQSADVDELKEVLHLTTGWIAAKLKTRELQNRRQQSKQQGAL
jgi:hypothetical protein